MSSSQLKTRRVRSAITSHAFSAIVQSPVQIRHGNEASRVRDVRMHCTAVPACFS